MAGQLRTSEISAGSVFMFEEDLQSVADELAAQAAKSQVAPARAQKIADAVLIPSPHLQDKEDYGIKGPLFKPDVWNYYKQRGHWADGLCVALQEPRTALTCCFPLFWPYRLFLTLRRASPLPVALACYAGHISTYGAAILAAFISALPLIYGGILLLLWDELTLVSARHPVIKRYHIDAGAIGSSFLGTVVISGLYWARLLLHVGRKYYIAETLHRPNWFLWKTSACLCCMNVRVGLHVDRSQGFHKPSRDVCSMIELSERRREA